MHSLVKRPIIALCTKLNHNEQTLHTYCNLLYESFLLYFISKIAARLEEEEAPCFMENASVSGSSKSQMLPSSLPASFFKGLSLPQKFNRFRFHIPATDQRLQILQSIFLQVFS